VVGRTVRHGNDVARVQQLVSRDCLLGMPVLHRLARLPGLLADRDGQSESRCDLLEAAAGGLGHSLGMHWGTALMCTLLGTPTGWLGVVTTEPMLSVSAYSTAHNASIHS
jgi:hypothetical protein